VDQTPDWVDNPPSVEDGGYYYTGIGFSEKIDVSRINAAHDLCNSILEDLGIHPEEIEPGSDAEVFYRELLEKFERTVFSSFSAISGLSIEKSALLEQNNGNNIFYVLALFSDNGLYSFKKELSEYFWVEEPAVSALEQEAARLTEEGRPFNAALKHMEAASTAVELNLLSVDVIVTRNLRAAVDLMDELEIAPEPFPEIKRGINGETPIVIHVNESGVPFWFYFEEKGPDGVMRERKARVVSNREGDLVFYYPIPAFYGDSYLRIELSGEMVPEEGTYPSTFDNLYERIRNAVSGYNQTYPLTVLDNSRLVSTGLFILDTDIINNPLQGYQTEDTVYSMLIDDGYNITRLDLSPDVLLNRNQSEMIRDLAAYYGDEYERIIFGITSISAYQPGDDFSTVEAEAWITVVQIRNGAVLYRKEYFNSAGAEDGQQAIGAVCRLIGKTFFQDYSSDLP
jgi:hypothetical protein